MNEGKLRHAALYIALYTITITNNLDDQTHSRLCQLLLVIQMIQLHSNAFSLAAIFETTSAADVGI